MCYATHKSSLGYGSHSAQKLLQPLRLPNDPQSPSAAPGGAPFGMHYRTLGDVAYFMLSLNTPAAVVETVQDRILKALQAE